MLPTRNHRRDLPLVSLEEVAVSARSSFGCLFSTSDEYEQALINGRRAEGRYDTAQNPWPLILFWICALAIACGVLRTSL